MKKSDEIEIERRHFEAKYRPQLAYICNEVLYRTIYCIVRVNLNFGFKNIMLMTIVSFVLATSGDARYLSVTCKLELSETNSLRNVVKDSSWGEIYYFLNQRKFPLVTISAPNFMVFGSRFTP